jgi:hypothetical protein
MEPDDWVVRGHLGQQPREGQIEFFFGASLGRAVHWFESQPGLLMGFRSDEQGGRYSTQLSYRPAGYCSKASASMIGPSSPAARSRSVTPLPAVPVPTITKP